MTNVTKIDVARALDGDRDALTRLVQRVHGPVFLPPGGVSDINLRANCPAGMTVVGTGINTGIGNADFLLSYGTFVGGFVDNDTSITIEAYVQAICASGVGNGGGTARAAIRGASSPTARFAADLAAARAHH
jgi:hypothetical protein